MTDEARKLGAALRTIIAPQRGEMIYAVLDGARDGGLASEALRMRLTVRTLFVGPTAPYMTAVAPYLIGIRNDAFLTRWARSWGADAGILLATHQKDFDAVWEHMRELFIARDEDGDKLFFRFFDPRVIRLYLPTCTPEEAREFFGPMRCLLVEAADPAAALLCTPGEQGVEIRTISTGVRIAPAGAGDAAEGGGT